MKTLWILPVIIIAVAASFAAGRHCGGTVAADLSPLGDTSAIEKTLSLTPQQTEQVRALAKEFQQRAQSACDKHCDARCEIARKLFKEDASPAAVQKYVDEMCAAYAEQERATMDHLVKLRALLTPEQAAQLNKQFAMCICDKCASSTGACCRAEK